MLRIEKFYQKQKQTFQNTQHSFLIAKARVEPPKTELTAN